MLNDLAIQPLVQSTLHTIRQRALTLLAQHEYSCYLLRTKLLQKGYAQPQVDAVLQVLIHQGLLSDQRFCAMRVLSRLEQGYGPYKIAFELRQHQVDETLIAEQLALADEVWLAALQKIRRKKFGLNLPIDPRQQIKQIRYLKCRGFSLNQIDQVLGSSQVFTCD